MSRAAAAFAALAAACSGRGTYQSRIQANVQGEMQCLPIFDGKHLFASTLDELIVFEPDPDTAAATNPTMREAARVANTGGASCHLFGTTLMTYKGSGFPGAPRTLKLYDVAQPAAPVEVGSLFLDVPELWQVEVRDSVGFFLSREGVIKIVDLEDRAAPKILSSLTLPLGNAGTRFALAGDRLYGGGWINKHSSGLASDSGMKMFDVSSPAAPAEVPIGLIPGGFNYLVSGNQLLVVLDKEAGRAGNTLYTLDGKSAPVLKNDAVGELPGTPQAVLPDGRVVCVADGIHIVSLALLAVSMPPGPEGKVRADQSLGLSPRAGSNPSGDGTVTVFGDFITYAEGSYAEVFSRE